jgi:hypothetical protein
VQKLYRILTRLSLVAAIPCVVLLLVGGISYVNSLRSVATAPTVALTGAALRDCRAVHVSEPWACDTVIEDVPQSSYRTPLALAAILAMVPVMLWLLAWVIKPARGTLKITVETSGRSSHIPRRTASITEGSRGARFETVDVLGSDWLKQQARRHGIEP